MTDEARITSIFEDWYEKHDRGEAPPPEDVIRANPDIAESLRARFAGLGVLDQIYQLPSDLPEGTPEEIGDFKIIREIGRGGMGVVYEAEQKSMQRRVALKVLSLAVTSTAHAVKRFQREARAGGKFHHTNVVPIYAMGQHAGHWYYAMELVEGSPLNTVLDDVRRSAQGKPVESPSDPTSFLGTDSSDPGYFLRVAGMFAGVADALDHAHQQGVIHRDIKPSNLLLEADGTLKLVDFGLAYIADTGMPSMTMTGDLIGTPVYMSPEQTTAKRIRVDSRTDIYSLGATLYEVLSLVPPFQASSLPDLCNQILNKDPLPPRRKNPRVPRDLETIVQKAMDKDREKRYQTAGALARDLQRFALGDPIRARRISPAARTWRKVKRHKVRSSLIAATVLLVAVGALFATRAAEESRLRRALEYDQLLSRAEEVMAASRAFVSDERGAQMVSSAGQAIDLLSEAIQLVPDRPDAFWLRSFVTDRAWEDRWADVQQAGRLGLSPRTWHLTRVQLLESRGRIEEAGKERELAEQAPRTPETTFFEGQMLLQRGHRGEAVDKFTEALRDSRSHRHLKYLTHRQRANVHEKLGNHTDALHDLRSLQDLGYDPLSVQVRIASLERRMGRETSADRKFEQVLVAVRGDGSAKTWAELCAECRNSKEPKWRETATAEAMAIHGKDVEVAGERIKWLNESGRHPEALDLALTTLKQHADAHGLHGELARVQLEAGDYGEARNAFERSLQLKPNCYQCLMGYGRALYELGLLDRSVETWNRAIELEPQHAVGYYNLAIDLTEVGRLEEAEAAYREAMERDASYVDAVNNLANLLHEQEGRNEEALELILRVIELEPENGKRRLNHANILMALNRYEEAKGSLEEALRLEPGMPEATLNMGALLLNGFDDAEGAMAWFRKGIEAAPDDPMGHHNLGAALNSLERYKEAIAPLKKAVELDDESADHHGLLAMALLFGAQDVQAARKEAERSIELPDPPPQAYFVRGVIHGDADHDFRKALADFEKTVELNPEYATAQRNIGWALRNLGEHEEAVKALEKARELDETDPRTHLWLARSLEQMGDPEAAVAALDRGLKVLPVQLLLLNQKGILLVHVLHRPQEALATFDLALAAEPGSPIFHSNRGLALSALGRIDEAAEALLETERLQPGDPHNPYRRGEIMLGAGGYDVARSGYERAIELAPQWDAPWFGLIHLLFETGAYEQGLEVNQKALERWPKHEFLRGMLCRNLRATGSADAAKRRAGSWIEESPKHGHHGLMHAYLCVVAGDEEATRAALAELDDPEGETLYTVAAIHVLLGDDDTAVECLEKSLEDGYRRHPGSEHEPDFEKSDDPRISELLSRFGG